MWPNIKSNIIFGHMVFSDFYILKIPKIEAVNFLNHMIRLEYAENPRAFLSFGAQLSEPIRFLIFTVATAIFLFGLSMILLFKKQDLLSMTGYSLVLGGGIGNLIDRIANGRVIDFINLGFGNLRTGIFNIADVAIVSGVLFILIQTCISNIKSSTQNSTLR